MIMLAKTKPGSQTCAMRYRPTARRRDVRRVHHVGVIWEDGKSGSDPKKETIGWRLENDTKGSGIWDRGDCETGVVIFQLIFLQELREGTRMRDVDAGDAREDGRKGFK